MSVNIQATSFSEANLATERGLFINPHIKRSMLYLLFLKQEVAWLFRQKNLCLQNLGDLCAECPLSFSRPLSFLSSLVVVRSFILTHLAMPPIATLYPAFVARAFYALLAINLFGRRIGIALPSSFLKEDFLDS